MLHKHSSRNPVLTARPPDTRADQFQEINKMLKSKRKFVVITLATFSLLVLGAGAFAQKHFMLANALRPEVKVQLSGSVKRDSSNVPLDKSIVVNPGEILDWTMTSEN